MSAGVDTVAAVAGEKKGLNNPRVVFVRRLLLVATAGWIAFMLYAHGEMQECKDALAANGTVHTICSPVSLEAPKVAFAAFLLLVLFAPEFAELEAFGIRVKALERVEGAVDRLTTEIRNAASADARATATGGSVNVSIGQVHAAQQGNTAVPPAAAAVGALILGSLAGWRAQLPRSWRPGTLVGLRAASPVGFELVGIAGPQEAASHLSGHLARGDTFLAAACRARAAAVDSSPGVVMVAAAPASTQPTAGLLVLVLETNTPREVPDEVALELINDAGGWAEVLRLLDAADSGHVQGGEGQ
jgi:hypothetical protein